MACYPNRFEEQLDRDFPAGSAKRALTEVADTAYMCKLWFESYLAVDSEKIGFNGADVMAMTKLVLEHEVAIVSAKGSERDEPASPHRSNMRR